MADLLQTFQRLVSPKALAPSRMQLGSETLDVIFRRHAQARRLVLRLNSSHTAVMVTVPRGVSRVKALEFT
jgi:hypothetical protein